MAPVTRICIPEAATLTLETMLPAATGMASMPELEEPGFTEPELEEPGLSEPELELEGVEILEMEIPVSLTGSTACLFASRNSIFLTP